MKLIRQVFFYIIIVCGAGSVVYAWPIPLTNSSFEERTLLPNKMPKGFGTYSSPGTKADFNLDDKQAHSGTNSLHTSNHGPQTALWRIEKSIPCHEGVPVNISVWVKTINSSGFVGIGVRLKDKKGDWLTAPIRGTDNSVVERIGSDRDGYWRVT